MLSQQGFLLPNADGLAKVVVEAGGKSPALILRLAISMVRSVGRNVFQCPQNQRAATPRPAHPPRVDSPRSQTKAGEVRLKLGTIDGAARLAYAVDQVDSQHALSQSQPPRSVQSCRGAA